MAEDLREIPLLDTCAEHKPMRVSVLDSAALAEDVGPLKMKEALRMLPILESGQRTGDFYSVCSGNTFFHDRW